MKNHGQCNRQQFIMKFGVIMFCTKIKALSICAKRTADSSTEWKVEESYQWMDLQPQLQDLLLYTLSLNH